MTSTSTRAAVVAEAGSEPTIREIELREPAPNEVLVRVVSTGVCHTDVAWADGQLFDRFPAVLGHESAGIVEAVGSRVTRVRPGDRVALGLAHHCGHCRFCESGRPMLCERREEQEDRMTWQGAPIVQGFGTGAFSELTIVKESSAILVPDGVPLDVAAITGCATSTGLGAVFNIAEVEYGSTVAVLGAGGVGLSVVMGCVLAGASRIVVADPNPERRAAALEFGATDAVEPTMEALTGVIGGRYDFVFESAGVKAAMELAIPLTDRGGAVTLIGAATPDVEVSFNALEFVPSQRRILGCSTGNVRPHVDFPRYFELYRQGRLPLDRLIAGSVDFADIAEGFDRNRRARGIRTIVRVGQE